MYSGERPGSFALPFGRIAEELAHLGIDIVLPKVLMAECHPDSNHSLRARLSMLVSGAKLKVTRASEYR
ncbi:hypothetical protein M404DRAFT_1005192 [Pisolithus tinctorius Marx 270]|uniref:Uncharacterized protein n=1 Tax=Pisolithus tinctorius Marx 270 TaxID=870435 RepID=A0A0C3INI5_PISTI|nr:hypothetical protein M404DRAFT_1005192 [Pisolithus tinctorius Marx 270]